MEIGGYVDAWCSRCKLELRHTIETIVDGKLKRVHCNTCRAQHMYRAHAPGTRAASNGSGLRTKTPKVNEYEAAIRGRPASAARAYAHANRWNVGDLVAHDVFGLGAVTGSRDNNKIDVLFPDGPRVLVQGR